MPICQRLVKPIWSIPSIPPSGNARNSVSNDPFRSVPAYQTGDDITVAWALSAGTKQTGAGGQSGPQAE